MATQNPQAETPQWDGEERRKGGDHRGQLTPDQSAVEIVTGKYKSKRPSDEQWQADQFTGGAEVRNAVRSLFDRLEGELDPKKVERLKAGFEQSVAIWGQAGLFTEERKEAGYVRPDFKQDYLPLLTPKILAMMEEGKGLDKGYDAPVWSPVDVLLHSEDLEKPSYFSVLRQALFDAYNGTAGGKERQTLLIGPKKQVIDAKKVNINAILWRWERYLQAGVVHNPKALDPKNHGGITEPEVLKGLQVVEKETGGVMRLERTQLVMPQDIGQSVMSARQWVALLGSEANPLPRETSSQDIKQAMAFAIYCLETQGWIPDFYDWNNPGSSRVALALKTYIPDESAAGAVAALYWRVDFSQFFMGRYDADDRRSYSGVRPGVGIGKLGL